MILIVLFSKIHTRENMLYAHEIKDITVDDLPKQKIMGILMPMNDV
jgi:hypothetical protein